MTFSMAMAISLSLSMLFTVTETGSLEGKYTGAGLSTRPKPTQLVIARSIKPTRRSLSCCASAPSSRAILMTAHASLRAPEAPRSLDILFPKNAQCFRGKPEREARGKGPQEG
jgi:hypothetical protein